jgi:hypothetical protein
MIDLRLRFAEPDLLDAAEDIERLLAAEEGSLTPSLRDLLLAVDEAITASYARAMSGHTLLAVEPGRL